MAKKRPWLMEYEEWFYEDGIARYEDGDRCWPEIAMSGHLVISGKSVDFSIERNPLTLDPWHVEIINENYIHCLVERFWDEKEAWEAVRSRLAEVGLDKM